MTDSASRESTNSSPACQHKPASRGNLVFALDATASRERTWDTACQLQARMFQEVAMIGSLACNWCTFVVPRTSVVNARPPAGSITPWSSPPHDQDQLRCRLYPDRAGPWSVAHETARRKITALVFVGDACEEDRDQLIEPATQLAQLSVPAFMFQEGHEPVARSRFQEIARMTHGAYHRFDQGSVSQLAELFAPSLCSPSAVPPPSNGKTRPQPNVCLPRSSADITTWASGLTSRAVSATSTRRRARRCRR